MTVNAGPLATDGWRTGVRWASAEQAAALAEQLTAGEVVRRPYETLPEIAVLVRNPEIVNAGSFTSTVPPP
ncbi:hypothetical protein [Actinoplanes aureus]|uniref:Uncharacterized protein n=1 Tax=Actinoplanes aureus TaxID=2792083 RepID=A0A931CG03_9ACTN|nr:hypothetical protein [Actinoplanes aureus]MBG0569225.1 hypothetical protein [Actinoplanes aureus]